MALVRPGPLTRQGRFASLRDRLSPAIDPRVPARVSRLAPRRLAPWGWFAVSYVQAAAVGVTEVARAAEDARRGRSPRLSAPQASDLQLFKVIDAFARVEPCGASKRESGVIRLAGRTLGIMTERFRGAGHGARVRWPDPQIAGPVGVLKLHRPPPRLRPSSLSSDALLPPLHPAHTHPAPRPQLTRAVSDDLSHPHVIAHIFERPPAESDLNATLRRGPWTQGKDS